MGAPAIFFTHLELGKKRPFDTASLVQSSDAVQQPPARQERAPNDSALRLLLYNAVSRPTDQRASGPAPWAELGRAGGSRRPLAGPRWPGAGSGEETSAGCWLAHRHAARLESVLLQIDDGVDFFFFFSI